MSEHVRLEIVANRFREIPSAVARIKEMAIAIRRNFVELEQHAANIKKIQSSNSIHSEIQGLRSLPDINISSIGQEEIQQSAKKFVSTVTALSSPKLQCLVSDNDDSMRTKKRIANEIQQLILTNSYSVLEFRSKEIESSYKELVSSIQKKHIKLAKNEQKSTAQIFGSSLKEMGYSNVKKLSTKGSVILRAKNNKTSIYAKVDLNGMLKIDTAGFEGRECEKAVDSLLKKLEEKGINARKKEQIFHGKVDGGELVKEVETLFNPLLPTSQICGDNQKEQNFRRQKNHILRNRHKIRNH